MFGRSAQVIWGERDEMTINIGTAGPAHISGSARQPARQAPSGRRQYVITFVMLAAVARRAVDRRTLRWRNRARDRTGRGDTSGEGPRYPRPGLVPGTRARRTPGAPGSQLAPWPGTLRAARRHTGRASLRPSSTGKAEGVFVTEDLTAGPTASAPASAAPACAGIVRRRRRELLRRLEERDGSPAWLPTPLTYFRGRLGQRLPGPQAARRRTSQAVAARRSRENASSQPLSIHWKGQNRLSGW